MRSAEAIRHIAGTTPPPKPSEIWMVVRQSPRFRDYVALVEKQLEDAREQYIMQTASEFNRGKVVALKEQLNFLLNGETP